MTLRTYVVEITATVVKQFEICANDEDEAVELASEKFNLNLEPEDKYCVEITDLDEVTGYRRRVA